MILADRELRDLIEQLEETRDALDATTLFEPTLDELRDLANEAVILRPAVTQQPTAALQQLRHDAAQRARKRRATRLRSSSS
jgi:hypothetical protein